MIEVILFRKGDRIDSAEVDLPESAVYAGQQMWDEARPLSLSRELSVGFYVEGKLVRMLTRRPEGG